MNSVRLTFPSARETAETYFNKVMAIELTKEVRNIYIRVIPIIKLLENKPDKNLLKLSR